MSVVALLMEYKTNGLPGACGPGDTLRLAHALRHPLLKPHEDITVISTLDPGWVAGLIPTRQFMIVRPTDQSETGAVNHLHLNGLLDQQLGSALDGARVIHTFIGSESYPWSAIQESSPTGRAYTRQRVDSSRPAESFMFHSKWVPPVSRRAPKPVLAAFVRRMETWPHRNTPDWFRDVVRDCAKEHGYQILWCGSVDSLEPKSNEEVLPQSRALLEQILALSGRATCAVGWNSGGLDLAAAAGLPILRIGEFQRVQGWGATYNSYLACATHVGLEANESTAGFERDVVANSIAALLANRVLFDVPRHVILSPNQALNDEPGSLKAQLIANEITWSGSTNSESAT